MILYESLAEESVELGETLGSALRALFQPLGGVEFPSDLRPHGRRPPPDFSGPEWASNDEA